MTASADVWDRCLENLKKDLNRQSFETWFRPTKASVTENNTLTVQVPNEFFRDWIRDHYQPQIQKALKTIHPEQLEIQFEVMAQASPASAPKTSAITTEIPLSVEAVEKPRLTMPTPSKTPGDSEFILNNKFNFESFVVGNSNRFAHAACLAVAESPARSYNPLFIYGGVGLGKTHLLQAIGNFVVEQNPNIRVLYISSEKFMNDFIQSIQSGRQQDFRNKYRTVDVLLIDDIQFWEGKEATQEEFFHTFNVLYEAQKQIVATSDSHPKEIKLEERLKNRFEMGLITDIQEPDIETRIAILRKKAESEGILVPNEVTVFIANHAKANIRELEGSMLRVIAFASLTKQEITLELVKEVLKDSLPSEERRISVDAIQRVVAERYNCKFSDMKSKKRTKQIAFPRQIAMFLSRELTSHSLSEIGASFGGKDHTTIIHAYEKIEELLTSDITLLSEVNSIKKQLTDGNYSV
ncbi:MAG TPA: chromosomal replication initiator protein DnaA [bacterium]|nr:chromosomal replication initiator protein DnaA [bacterium]